MLPEDLDDIGRREFIKVLRECLDLAQKRTNERARAAGPLMDAALADRGSSGDVEEALSASSRFEGARAAFNEIENALNEWTPEWNADGR